MNVSDTSMAAYENSRIYRSHTHQKILAALTTRPMSREMLANYLNMRLQTICARVKELLDQQILTIDGEGKTLSGCRCQLLTLNNGQQPMPEVRVKHLPDWPTRPDEAKLPPLPAH